MSVRGLDSLAEIIDLLKNPAKYDAKMAELRGEIDRYHAAIESVTKLSEVNEYTLNIREKSAKIDAEYVAHQEKVNKELAALADEIKQAKKKLKDRELKLEEQEKQAKEVGEQQLLIAKDQTAFAEKLEKKSVELTQREAKLDELEKELAERKAKLLAAFA